MSAPICDFEPQELDVIQQSLCERYGRPIQTQLADTDLCLNPPSPVLSTCAAVYWEVEGCHFIINKVADSRFHCQFFYTDDEHYGTGQEFYDGIVDCALSLLRTQADHALQSKGQ